MTSPSSTNTNNLINQENATTRIMGKTTTTNKPLQPLRRAALDDLGNRIHNLQNANQTTKGTIMGPPIDVKKKTELSVMSKISDKDMSLLEERIKRSSRRSVIPKNAFVNSDNETVVMNNDEGQDMDEEEESVPVPMLPPTVAPEVPKKEVQGQLESDFMNDLDKITSFFQKLPVQTIDTELQ